MNDILEAIAESLRWRDTRPLRMALRREAPLVERLYTIPDFGVCENYYQSSCPSQHRPRYGNGSADRWCFPCEVVAAIEGDAYDPEQYLRTDAFGRPFSPTGGPT